MQLDPMRVGILGAGAVAPQYLPNLVASDGLVVIGVGDLDYQAAENLAREYHIPKVFDGEGVLGCEDVELIVNLTPHDIHFETNRRILEAGKHLYSEKPLALTAERAAALLAMAQQAGLSVATAPDTLLGVGFQASRRAVEAGMIGKPLSGFASMLRPLPPITMNRIGGIAFFDMAPYYLTALINLFGPAASVSGISQLGADPPDLEPLFTSCVLEFTDHVLCTVTLRWGDTPSAEIPVLRVSGTEGELMLPNPDTFSAHAGWRKHGESSWRVVPGASEAPEANGRGPNLRGVGIADLARSIREGGTPRANAEVAVHVIEIIESLCMPEPSTGRVGGRLQTSCTKPPVL